MTLSVIAGLQRWHLATKHAEDTEEVTRAARVPFCHGAAEPFNEEKKQLHRKKKSGEAEAHSFLQDSELSDFLNISDIQSTLLPMVTLR